MNAAEIGTEKGWAHLGSGKGYTTTEHYWLDDTHTACGLEGRPQGTTRPTSTMNTLIGVCKRCRCSKKRKVA